MEASVLREWLGSQIEIVRKVCDGENVFSLSHVSDLLAIRKGASVADVCKALNKVSGGGGSGVTLGATAELLNLMVASACRFAKAGDAKDLKRFAAVIDGKKGEHIDSFVAKATEALAPQPRRATAAPALTDNDLRAYLKRLEEALGNEEGFEDVYLQVSKDARLKAPEAKKLARAFVGKSGRSKSDALGLIYERHKSLMGARYRAEATGGRLAG